MFEDGTIVEEGTHDELMARMENMLICLAFSHNIMRKNKKTAIMEDADFRNPQV